MISNDLIQASVISKLKANSGLTDWLTDKSAGSEIRESHWQGAQFAFPAVRVELGTQVPEGPTSVCYLTNGTMPFTVYAFTEDDSSRNANILAGLVNAALIGTKLSGTGFKSLLIESDGLTGAQRTTDNLWRAVGLYRAYVYQTS